jgi:large subunit ribosomal protein L35
VRDWVFSDIAPEQDRGNRFVRRIEMPKIKTYKAAAKRFKYSGSGKLMRTKVGKSHLRRKKSKRVKRQFDEMHEVTDLATRKRVRKLAPYLKK